MSSEKSFQDQINILGIGDCGFDQGTLAPCGYHRDRAQCLPLRLDSAMSLTRIDPTVACVPSADDTKTLAQSLCDPGSQWPPAGGWYLVREQRQWFVEKVLTYLQRTDQSSLRILEAGAASHVHHFTYLTLLQEALDRADRPVRLEVVTVDHCLLPILAIQACQDGIEGPLSVQGFEIALHPSFSDLMSRTGVLDDPRLTCRAFNRDLKDSSELAKLGHFDLVTEHFISAVLGNFELLDQFRATYSRLLRPGGWLLCACGLTRRTDPHDYSRFIELNGRHSLELRDIEGTWDPYGMKREQIEVLLTDRPLKTHLDNTLFAFERTA